MIALVLAALLAFGSAAGAAPLPGPAPAAGSGVPVADPYNPAPAAPKPGGIAGTYRCWSVNVGGAGGHCAVGTPPLLLNADGTYSMSSERGTYKVSGGAVLLSKSATRGPGRLVDGNKIVFEYDLQGLHHTVTYLRY